MRNLSTIEKVLVGIVAILFILVSFLIGMMSIRSSGSLFDPSTPSLAVRILPPEWASSLSDDSSSGADELTRGNDQNGLAIFEIRCAQMVSDLKELGHNLQWQEVNGYAGAWSFESDGLTKGVECQTDRSSNVSSIIWGMSIRADQDYEGAAVGGIQFLLDAGVPLSISDEAVRFFANNFETIVVAKEPVFNTHDQWVIAYRHFGDTGQVLLTFSRN